MCVPMNFVRQSFINPLDWLAFTPAAVLYATMKHSFQMTRRLLLALPLLMTAGSAMAEERALRVAVASNFLSAARGLADLHEFKTGQRVILINGSSGTLFAQIANGAPVDLFLSADHERPQRLAELGLAPEPQAYARGELVLLHRLWGNLDDLADHRIAIADPDVAPYGQAALQVLERLNITPETADLVSGANVSAAAGLFASGNVDFALVSRSVAKEVKGLHPDSVLTTLPAPEIEVLQFAALITPDGQAFLDLILSDEGTFLLKLNGYQPVLEATE